MQVLLDRILGSICYAVLNLTMACLQISWLRHSARALVRFQLKEALLVKGMEAHHPHHPAMGIIHDQILLYELR